jgi:hypothetical protein
MANQFDHHDAPNNVKLYTEIELLKRDNLQLKEILSKLDVSVEKIADAATNISKILALHEQRVGMLSEDIAYFSKNHTEILADIKSTKDTIAKDNKERDERITKLEQYRWYLLGAATAIGFVINKLPDLLK